MTGLPASSRVPGSALLLSAAVVVGLSSVAWSQPQPLVWTGAPEEATIGDPWWDEAAPAVRPAAERAAGGVAQPKDPAHRQAQGRLAGVRRSRGMQLLKRELSLVRASCPSLTPTARERIVAAGLAVVESQAVGRTPLANGVEAELGRVLEEAAGPAAAAAYQRELDARAARKRAAAIAVLVAAIDADAELPAEQRRAVTAALRREWRPEWESVLATAQRQRVAQDRLPQGVVGVAAAVLDEETFAAWQKRVGEAVP
jgi:hypothetical protein